MVVRTIKRQLIFWLEAVLIFFRRTPKPTPPFPGAPSAFVIIKLDALGDYLLFRNFIPAIKNELPEGEKLVLVCNAICKPLVEELDPELFDAVHYLNLGDVRWKHNQRIEAWNHINSNYSTTTLFQPSHSRRFCFDYFLAGFNGKNKIGVQGNTRNSNGLLKYLGSKYYSHLLEFPDPLFEFSRNKCATEKLLRKTLPINTPFFPELPPYDSTENRWVIFPEASVEYREWCPKKFAQLIDLIYHQFGKKCSLVGIDGAKAKEITNNLKRTTCPPEVLTGKTNLIELIRIIQYAEIVISNETVASQIAGKAKTKLVCLTYGEDYGNFIPYPAEMNSPMTAIQPKQVGNINSISCDEVMDAIQQILQQ